jgi:hypothetical protein
VTAEFTRRRPGVRVPARPPFNFNDLGWRLPGNLRGFDTGALAFCCILRAPYQNDLKQSPLGLVATVEGKATSVYLSELLRPLGMKVTRIAMGVPVGSDLEFANEVTMWKPRKAAANSNQLFL